MGTATPTTDYIVQFKDLVTGRIKQAETTSDGDGLITVNVDEISGFFSPNFVYELTVLTSNSSQCNVIEWTIVGGTEPLSCVNITFVDIDVDIDFQAEIKAA